jgi:putative PEP-CTERM system TPR-repeat lipoprotein
VAKGHPIANHLRGVVQFKQSKYPEAKTSFEAVLKVYPDYLPAVLWLGLTNFVVGNNEQAAKQFSRYAREYPNAIQIQALLALVQARLGRAPEAREALDALSKVDVKDPLSLATLAQTYLFFGQTGQASTYLTKAVAQKPDAADLRVALATTLSQQGDRGQAIAQLENAVHLDPGMASADAALIQNLIRDKQFDKAMAAVEALEKKRPNDPTTLNLKGGVYFAKNDLVNARKSFEQAFALGPNSIAAAVNLAQLDVLEKRPDAARQRFQAILVKDKNNVEAMMGLAGVAQATGQEADYVTWLESAAKTSPSAVLPRLLLATYYMQKNDVRKALTLAQEAQTAQPNNVQALDILATAQLGAGEANNSVTTYNKLIALVPNNPTIYFQLATAQVASKSIPSARESLNQALALRSDYRPAQMLLASLEVDAGRAGEALKIAQQIQKQHPEVVDGFALQGDVLMSQKQYPQALKAYEKGWEIAKSNGLLIKIHQALSAAGNEKEAEARMLQWLTDHPDDIVAHRYLAASYALAGQNKRAIEQFELALAIDPKNAATLNDLAWLYQQTKDPRALPTAERAYEANANNPQILDTLGWILLDQGEVTRSLRLLQRAAEGAPTSTEIRYHLAAAYAKSGDTARARRELADLLTGNKKFPQRQQAQELLRRL